EVLGSPFGVSLAEARKGHALLALGRPAEARGAYQTALPQEEGVYRPRGEALAPGKALLALAPEEAPTLPKALAEGYGARVGVAAWREVALLAASREGYARLSGHLTQTLAEGSLPLEALLADSQDLVLLSGGRQGFPSALLAQRRLEALDRLLRALKEAFRDRLFLSLYHGRLPGDDRRVRILRSLAQDLLGLRMLSALEEAREEVFRTEGVWLDLEALPQEEGVYRPLWRGETLGVFQLESPAQTAMSRRLRPRTGAWGRRRRSPCTRCWTGSWPGPTGSSSSRKSSSPSCTTGQGWTGPRRRPSARRWLRPGTRRTWSPYGSAS
ncbi:hypothetical protein CSW28_06100, partial [Thermus scotoductus]